MITPDQFVDAVVNEFVSNGQAMTARRAAEYFGCSESTARKLGMATFENDNGWRRIQPVDVYEERPNKNYPQLAEGRVVKVGAFEPTKKHLAALLREARTAHLAALLREKGTRDELNEAKHDLAVKRASEGAQEVAQAMASAAARAKDGAQ